LDHDFQNLKTMNGSCTYRKLNQQNRALSLSINNTNRGKSRDLSCHDFASFKGTVRPDCIFMRMVPLDRPWKGHQPLLIFLLVGITDCVGTNRNLFRQTVLQKCGRINNCSLGYTAREQNVWRKPTTRNPNQNRAALWRIFSTNKSVTANRKKGFYTNRDARLRTLKSFQIFKTEIKKSKTFSGRCPFQGLYNGTTLMQIQSGRTVPLSFRILQPLPPPTPIKTTGSAYTVFGLFPCRGCLSTDRQAVV
jgi:hypothetical protein